ncbi:MAG: hypothetical protein RR585_01450 [Coprobacillus sp.]
MNDENSIIYVSQSKSTLEQDYKNGYPLVSSEPKDNTLADLHHDDSGRSWKTGFMDLNILRENVYSTILTFLDIDYITFKKILNAVKNKKDGGFYASVFNYELEKRVILHMYRSDRTYKEKNYIEGWRFDLSVSLIEL